MVLVAQTVEQLERQTVLVETRRSFGTLAPCPHPFIRPEVFVSAPSSNGRTKASEAFGEGSNPSGAPISLVPSSNG